MKREKYFYNPENKRYYRMWMQKDLLGDLVLFVSRGGSYRNNNVIPTRVFKNNSDGEQFFEKLSKKRIRNGYLLREHNGNDAML